MSEWPSKVIYELRKSGNLKEAWKFGVQAVKENPDDQYLKDAMFWVCYDYIKDVHKKLETRSNSQNDKHKPNPEDIKKVEYYTRCIEKLEVDPNDFNYRNLLISCNKNLRHFPNLVTLLFSKKH